MFLRVKLLVLAVERSTYGKARREATQVDPVTLQQMRLDLIGQDVDAVLPEFSVLLGTLRKMLRQRFQLENERNMSVPITRQSSAPGYSNRRAATVSAAGAPCRRAAWLDLDLVPRVGYDVSPTEGPQQRLEKRV